MSNVKTDTVELPENGISTAPSGKPFADSPALPLTALHEVLLALSQERPRDETLTLLAEKAALLVNATSAVVALLETDRETIGFTASAGEFANEVRGTRARTVDTLFGKTARTGEPTIIYRNPTAAVENETEKPISAAIVPIFVDGLPTGALAAMNRRDGKPFSGDDLLALSTLAAAANVAISDARLRHENERQNRELTLLYDAVRSVSGKLSIQEVLRTVVEQVAAHLDSGVVVTLLANDERSHLYVAEEQGLDNEMREIALPTASEIGRAMLYATRPLFLSFEKPDGEDDPTAFAPVYDSPFPNLRIRSGLAAPIRTGHQTLGAVLALSPQPTGVYTLADANLLFALATQAAVALENAGLYEDSTHRADEAVALYELSQAITSTLRLKDVLERVADATLRLLNVDKFALFLRDSTGQRLQMEIQRGLPSGAAERIRPLIGQGIPGWVVQYETPTAVQDVSADARNRTAPMHREGAASLVCMPLQIGHNTMGALCAMSSQRRLFTVGEVELLYTITNQAAIAIENARNYDDVRTKSRELRRYFHRIAKTLGSAQSPVEVPPLVVDLTREMMDADRCALYRVQTDANGQPFLHCEASAGYKSGDKAESPVALEIARRARPIIVSDTAADSRFAERIETESGTEERSPTDKKRTKSGRSWAYLGVPIREGRRAIGVLEVYTRTPHEWRNEEIRLLLTFASQVAVAFQNARLMQQGRSATGYADFLERLIDLFSKPKTPDANRIVETVADFLEIPVGLIHKNKTVAATKGFTTMDNTTGQKRAVSARDWRMEAVLSLPLSADEKTVSRVDALLERAVALIAQRNPNI